MELERKMEFGFALNTLLNTLLNHWISQGLEDQGLGRISQGLDQGLGRISQGLAPSGGPGAQPPAETVNSKRKQAAEERAAGGPRLGAPPP